MQRFAFSRLVSGLILAGYWCLLFVLTHIHIGDLPGPAHWTDKILHLLAYAGLGMLAAWYLWVRGKLTLACSATLMLILIGYATVDELSQNLLPYRVADVWDWAADVVGSGLGICAVALFVVALGRSCSPPKGEGAMLG